MKAIDEQIAEKAMELLSERLKDHPMQNEKDEAVFDNWISRQPINYYSNPIQVGMLRKAWRNALVYARNVKDGEKNDKS